MDDFHRLEINRDRFKDNQKEIKRQDMNNEQMQKGKIFLKVVQTQAICLKSMSERGGSDIV